MYIKINGFDEHYDASITTFKTQHGNDAVGIVGDMPVTDKGFILYEDNGKVYNDLSEYIYSYGDSGKAYTKVEETIEYGATVSDPLPPSPYEVLSSRVSKINSQVNSLTPYTETKDVYIGDKECRFDKVINGNISAYVEIGGEQKNCDVVVYETYIAVVFEEAEDTGTVTIKIL